MRVRSLSQWILPGLLACSLGANLWLTHRLRSTEDDLVKASRLTPGEVIPALEARLESGEPRRLEWGGRKVTLIYYFDPGCGWCVRNGAAFEALAAQIGAEADVYSYTPDLRGLNEFRLRTHHSGTVITDDRADIRRVLRLHGTPQTLVIDHAGRVLKNWSGAYVGSTKAEIQNYFHVNIPELAERPNG
jgi:hypothetical protein